MHGRSRDFQCGGSGLYGFMQMANGALCTLAVGYLPANPAISAASVLLAGILLGNSSSGSPENDRA